ncbi:MAG: heat shock protein transcriptional repressor HspR [Actinomycetota bacterium]
MFSDDTTPVYAISVAAQLSGLHPQTLRQYDKLGLVSPQRTNGRNRLYSARDIARLQEVADLSAAGVSLEGIRRVLDLQAEVERLRDELEEYVAEKRSTALVLWNPSRRRGA